MLTEAQQERFRDDGFLVLENVLQDASLAAVDEAFRARLDELTDYLNVEIPAALTTLNEKMLALEDKHPGACLIFTHSHIPSSALFALWSGGPLVDIASSLLGPDIDGHPFFAVRPKPPGMALFNVRDSAYLQDGAQEVPQLSVWIPLMDATRRENGCMEYARGVHRHGKELRHIPQDYIEHGNRAWYVEIEPALTSAFNVVTCEVSRGSCIVFSHLAPHRSLPNLSSTCRWSIDLRYLPAGRFSGTQQAPIPFRRSSPLEAQKAEAQKQAYLARQVARDKNVWRHRVEKCSLEESLDGYVKAERNAPCRQRFFLGTCRWVATLPAKTYGIEGLAEVDIEQPAPLPSSRSRHGPRRQIAPVHGSSLRWDHSHGARIN